MEAAATGKIELNGVKCSVFCVALRVKRHEWTKSQHTDGGIVNYAGTKLLTADIGVASIRRLRNGVVLLGVRCQ